MLRKIILAELNYDIYNKELFMIVVVFQTWRVYVKKASEIIVFIDYKNLINFCTTKELNWYQIKWSELFLFYKFRIEYRPNKDNNKTDILSRRLDIIDNYKDRSHNILWQNKNNLLSPNNNILAVTIIIKSKVKQHLKKIY